MADVSLSPIYPSPENQEPSGDFLTILDVYFDSFPSYERHKHVQDLWNLVVIGKDYHLYAIHQSGKAVGMLAYRELVASGSDRPIYYLEHLAVAADVRGLGVGHSAVDEWLEFFEGSDPESIIVLESDLPDKDVWGPRRLNFYRRCGFHVHLDFEYFQPQYDEGDPIQQMVLVGKILGSGRALNNDELKAASDAIHSLD